MVKAMDAIFKPVTVEFGQVHIAGGFFIESSTSGVEASRRTGQKTIHVREDVLMRILAATSNVWERQQEYGGI